MVKITNNNFFSLIFGLIDLMFLNVIHLALLLNVERDQGNNVKLYTFLFIFNNISWLCCSYVTGMYVNYQYNDFERFAKRTVQTFVLFTGSILVFMFFYNFNFSRLLVSLNLIGIVLELFFSRLLFIWGTGYFGKQDRFNKKIVLLDNGRLVATKSIKQLYIVESKREIKLKDNNLPLYLFFVAIGESDANGKPTKELLRRKIKIDWTNDD